MIRESLPAFIVRLARDRRGVSAVEFALIAPVMIAFYFAMGELCQGYMAQKRLSHTASSIANLVAQTDVVKEDEVADVMAIGALIMKPFPATSLSTRITSVTRDANGVAKVDWSRASGAGLPAYADQAVVTVPTDMIGNGASLVMAEA
ncbi:MAG TPA: TadE/TadG family type IV pilus assembly protein, partial [Brevundimonas sp.]